MEKKAPKITKKQLLPYIRKAWNRIRLFLNGKKVELGHQYDPKNVYEQLCRRFCDPSKEAEKFFDEYMLCLNKASNQPSSIRNVILEVGGHAVSLYLEKREDRLKKRRLQRQQKKEEQKTE